MAGSQWHVSQRDGFKLDQYHLNNREADRTSANDLGDDVFAPTHIAAGACPESRCSMNKRTPSPKKSGLSGQPPDGKKQRIAGLSVGDDLICRRNISIHSGSLAWHIHAVASFLREHWEQLADTTDKQRHTEAYRALNKQVKALDSKWKQVEDQARQHGCLGHSSFFQFEETFDEWLVDALNFPSEQAEANRVNARLWAEGRADESLPVTEAVRAKAEGLSSRHRNLVRRAVKIEQDIQRAPSRAKILPVSRKRKRRKRTEPTLQMEKAYTAHRRGLSYRTIAEELGVSRTTIGRWVKIAELAGKRKRSVRARNQLPRDRREQLNLPASDA